MPLTRGDKLIIGSAVALAAAVVLGLAALKKPFLFSHDAGPQPVAIEPAPAAMKPGPPPSARPVTSPVEEPAASPVVAASPPPAAMPGARPSAALPGATAPAPALPSPPPAAKPAQAGDETLDKMFAEITKDDKAPGKTTEPKAAGPDQVPGAASGSVPVVVANEPQPAPAAADNAATGTPAAQPAAPAKGKKTAGAKPTKPAKGTSRSVATPPSQAPAKAKAAPKSAAASGNVIRLVAEEKPGEYVLVVQTNRPPEHFQKMFMADPPRMVLDLAGAWSYSGPTTKATGERFIRQIRVGRHADMFRVVLDMGPEALSQLRGTPTVERVPEGVALKIPK